MSTKSKNRKMDTASVTENLKPIECNDMLHEEACQYLAMVEVRISDGKPVKLGYITNQEKLDTIMKLEGIVDGGEVEHDELPKCKGHVVKGILMKNVVFKPVLKNNNTNEKENEKMDKANETKLETKNEETVNTATAPESAAPKTDVQEPVAAQAPAAAAQEPTTPAQVETKPEVKVDFEKLVGHLHTSVVLGLNDETIKKLSATATEKINAGAVDVQVHVHKYVRSNKEHAKEAAWMVGALTVGSLIMFGIKKLLD